MLILILITRVGLICGYQIKRLQPQKQRKQYLHMKNAPLIIISVINQV
jgi:hypothetical protein